MEVDPTKIQIVQSCLEASFKNVKPDKLNGRVVFNDGAVGASLNLTRRL